MKCKTIRKGFECAFASEDGCTFPGGMCHEIVEKCEGCSRIVEFEGRKYCAVYPFPKIQWDMGVCNMATHHKREEKREETFLNPLKAAKRMARGGGRKG